MTSIFRAARRRMLAAAAVLALATPTAQAAGIDLSLVPGAQEFSDALQKSDPQLWSYFETAFPEDYKTLIATLVTIDTASPEAMQTNAKKAILDLFRGKYAGKVSLAQDDKLIAFFAAEEAFYTALQTNPDPKVCGNVVLHSTAHPANAGVIAAYKEQMSARTVAMIDLAHSGINNPVERAPASEADWQAYMERAEQMGLTSAYDDAVNAGDPGNPALCADTILMFQVIQAGTDAGDEAIRAQAAAEMAGVAPSE